MRAHHGVFCLERLLDLIGRRILDSVFPRLGDIRLAGGIHPAQSFQQALHCRRQGFERRVAAREQRIATERRHLARDQHRRHRGLCEVGGIGMPDAPKIVALVRQFQNRDDQWKAFNAFHERIFDDLSEALGKGLECRFR